MTHLEIRKKFLDFFEKKGHRITPSSSLIPDDPSVLLTTAGMQQFKPYYINKKDPLKDVHPNLGAPLGSYNAVSIQKCFRTSDIDEVGDESHLTFFEMLGNFSFGGYWKKKAIGFAYDFIVKELNLTIDYVSIFEGDEKNHIPADEESRKIWLKLGMPEEKIKLAGKKDNFWGPTGEEGPCGPTAEIYINGIEVWNLVFNEYYCRPDGSFEKLKTQGVDTGMGLERLAMILQNKNSVFETDLFAAIVAKVKSQISPLKSAPNKLLRNLTGQASQNLKSIRIIADHIKASIFLIADGIEPLNVGRGYILRRLIRRAVRYEKLLDFKEDFIGEIAETVIEIYKNNYPEVVEKKKIIFNELKTEKEKFEKTLVEGLKELNKLFPIGQAQKLKDGDGVKIFNRVDAKRAFFIYQTYGFPFEMIQEELAERLLTVDEEKFKESFQKHQEISRAGVEKKFGGLRENAGEKEARLHTAAHLLHQALREIFGDEVRQMGSDITEERLRFDFSFGRKMTPEEIKKAENLVNQKIKEGLIVKSEEMTYEEAVKSGALAFFKEKYPERVKVCLISGFSREICAGPHAKNTNELGEFKIVKEESSSAGVRRIKAVLAKP